MGKVLFLIGLGLAAAPTASAFLGTELGPLLQLVSGQVQELERLTQSVGVARDQVQLLRTLNDGIERTVTQIQTLQTILERSRDLNPREVKSLADLNDLLERAQGTKALIDDLLLVKVDIANQAIARSALQSDTTYRMGEEMVVTGSQLASESQRASPGRANQITAAASSAQMLSQGVELQTMSQMVQLQALLLEFQKSQVEREVRTEKLRQAQFERQLGTPVTKRSRR